MYVWVEEGTTNGDTGWLLTTNNPIVLGTTALVFAQIAASSSITGGAGLVKTGNVLDVGQGTGIIVGADDVSINTALVSRHYAQNAGDGSNLSYIIAHNFNTQDVIVQVRDNSSPYAYVVCDVEATTVNAVTVRFSVAPASNKYRVIVTG
jgi:hypothetical protein